MESYSTTALHAGVELHGMPTPLIYLLPVTMTAMQNPDKENKISLVRLLEYPQLSTARIIPQATARCHQVL